MKAAFIFLAFAVFILFLIWLHFDIQFSNQTTDIHFHDTYFIIANWHFALAITLFIGTSFSLGGVIGTRFQNKTFVAIFLTLLAVNTYIIWNLYRSFHQG